MNIWAFSINSKTLRLRLLTALLDMGPLVILTTGLLLTLKTLNILPMLIGAAISLMVFFAALFTHPDPFGETPKPEPRLKRLWRTVMHMSH